VPLGNPALSDVAIAMWIDGNAAIGSETDVIHIFSGSPAEAR